MQHLPLPDCSESGLFAQEDDTLCQMGEMVGVIPNGILCYTGLTPGSTATYSCDKGNELSGIGQLVCQDDGTWDSPTPTCVESGLY